MGMLMVVDAYCWPQSAKAGQRVDVMISGPACPATVTVTRVGASDEPVMAFPNVSVTPQPVPADVGHTGCRWAASLGLEIPPQWRTGFYLVRVDGGNHGACEAFFVVRATEPGDSILVLSTSTWAAYNDWGAPSFYTGGHESSLRRPLPSGFLTKANPERYRAAGFMDMPRDERRAHFADHSIWSSAAGFANWERLFVGWAEAHGVEFDYATSLDLATDPDLLDPYQLYLSVGHDEYWSASMRDAVESWVHDGGHAVFLSGNTSFWQVRFEADASRIVGYKFDLADDPVVGTADEHTVSTMWSDPLCARPENEMTGVSFTRGGYANMANSPAGGGYTVHRPDHWAFTDTGLVESDVIGADAMVVGYECDGCAMTWERGRPVPTGEDGTPANLTILATAPAKLWETHEIAPGLSDAYVGELNWVAERIAGGDTAENRSLFDPGAAVMAYVERGSGWVFTTGCTDWAYGLGDELVAQITRNLIQAGRRMR